MKSLVVILLGLFGSWHFIDLHSKSFLHSAIAPLVFFLLLVALIIWLVRRIDSGEGSSSSDSGTGWISSDFSDGGDFNGGGDGGGSDGGGD